MCPKLTDSQGTTLDARRLQFAVSYLGANVQGHWSAYVTCKPNPTFADLEQNLLTNYDKSTGLSAVRRQWHSVGHGSRLGQGYVTELSDASSQVVALSSGDAILESEKVATFLSRLRKTLRRACAFATNVNGPHQCYDSLVAWARCKDDTDESFLSQGST